MGVLELANTPLHTVEAQAQCGRHKASTTSKLSPLYKSIISLPTLVTKQACVSWRNKKITSNLNPALFSLLSPWDSFIASQDKRRATGRDFIMRLGISECKGSSEAEWNEQPGAYVLKSQLSQAQRSSLLSSLTAAETLQGHQSASTPSISMAPRWCMCAVITRNQAI